MNLCQSEGGGRSCWVELQGGGWEDGFTVDKDIAGQFNSGCVKLDLNKESFLSIVYFVANILGVNTPPGQQSLNSAHFLRHKFLE